MYSDIYLIAAKRGEVKHIRLTDKLPLCRLHSDDWVTISYLDVSLLELFSLCKRCKELKKTTILIREEMI